MNKAEIKVRQGIVENLSLLVARREANRKKRKLRPGDNITETIKFIGRKIAEGKY